MKQDSWLEEAVRSFGEACRDKLSGPMSSMGREAAIRAPLEGLLGAAGQQLKVAAVFHDEVRDTQRQVRPDYGVTVGGAISGYVEVKAPGKSVDPASFTGHDLNQWERQRDLPNLLYTNGTEWRLYRDGEAVSAPVYLTGGTLDTAGRGLAAPAGFEEIITDFLRWRPAPITSVGALVRSVAPLTRLLRGEVADQLGDEARAVAGGADADLQPFSGLARDWRALLFPTADDKIFADGYAQAVTFALLLARSEGIDLQGVSLHEVGSLLSDEHSLMGKALQVLTDDVAADFRVTLDLLVRVVGAVDWPRIQAGKRDTYLHLYEHFLEEYDNELRKQSGTYYTPTEVVEEMVRLAEEALVSTLGKPLGFRDETVHVIDPAMGTGTYLIGVLERIAARVAADEGPGAVAGALSESARRLNGFELQMGPYAVAELRTADLLTQHGVDSSRRANLFVTNTLDDPYVADNQLAQGLLPIAQSRRRANRIKKDAHITVVIGNPPYRERAEGMGGWVEQGSPSGGAAGRAVLDDFRMAGNGRVEYVLKNLYVYFWRWATWKVWESTSAEIDGDAGVVCFITTAGHTKGPGFKGMRRYLREWATDGWVIDLTPEGQTPDVPTRVFPGVRQPLAIALFVRKPGKDKDVPARIRVRALKGRRAEKFAQLAAVTLAGEGWEDARPDWVAPLTAAATSGWDEFPALGDLMPWTSPGIKANRRWVFAASPAILQQRWARLFGESDAKVRSALFKETGDRLLTRPYASLPGHGVGELPALATHLGPSMTPVRIGYRAFDRQWIIPDGRVVDRARPELWAARLPGQVFVVEQHSKAITSGPGLLFSALIPDMDHFKGSEGGRTLPLLHPDGTPNLVPGLTAALASALSLPASAAASDVLAYVAAVVSHPAFTQHFADELATPGIRVPFTAERSLWDEALALGHRVLWLHTYGVESRGAGRGDAITLPPGDPRKPLSVTPITDMPETMTYDQDTLTLRLGTGTFSPVTPEVWEYAVGGRGVLKSWFNYRKRVPGGKKSSPLDDLHVDSWPAAWTTELIELLSVLVQLVELEGQQAELLAKVLAAPLLSTSALEAAGVAWPKTSAHRSARMPLPEVHDGSTLL